MTDFIKPIFDDDVFGPPRTNAPEGDYVMKIVFEPYLNQGQSGNKYLSVLLGFVNEDEAKKYNQVKTIVLLEGSKEYQDEKTGETKTRSLTWKLAGLLKAIGLTTRDIKNFEFGGEIGSKASLVLNGEPLMLEGRTLVAHLTEREYNDKLSSDVKYFRRQD